MLGIIYVVVHTSIQKRNLVGSKKFLLVLTYLQSICAIVCSTSTVLRPSALLLKEVHSSIRLDEDEI